MAVALARAAALAVAVASTLALASCSSSQTTAAAQASGAFYRALAEGDGAAACAVLAARTRSEVEQSDQLPCDRAILEEDIPDLSDDGSADPREVAAFGTSAQVRYADETTFLSRYVDGWRVVAAGCTRVPGGRYDCQVEAG